MKQLISIQQAEEQILSNISLAGTETVELEEASGRYLREPIKADRPIPPFDRVMMDGISINSLDFFGIGSTFEIAGIQGAGAPALEKTKPQTCFEVMTGAVLPIGCDCVVPVEEISITGNSVILSPDAIVEKGKFIHPAGSDSPVSSTLVTPNHFIHAPELAIAASVGATNLTVSSVPRITILTSGDEVIPPEETPSDFQIRSSHPIFLKHLIESNNLGICTHIHLPDQREATAAAIKSSLQNSDFLILTGGISKGKFDFVASELKKIVGDSEFHGVKQRPGKPFAFWNHPDSNTPIFALPGNPVSVAATAARYVLPALRKYQGQPACINSIALASSYEWKPPIPGFAPCKILPDQTAVIHQMQNSGDYLCLSSCSGFIELEKPSSTYTANSKLPFYPF